jgi:NADH-quinone oxidoreductase subunit N
MTVFMVSLMGVPPTGGFWAKILIFGAAIERGGELGVGLAVAMLINSVISIYYYFSVPRQMYFRDAEDTSRLRVSPAISFVVVAAVLVLLAIFVVPNAVAHLTDISSLIGAD